MSETYTITLEEFEQKLDEGAYYLTEKPKPKGPMPADKGARRSANRALVAYKERQAELLREFKEDMFIVMELTTHPKRDKLWHMAWNAGHAEGFYEIWCWARTFATLLDGYEAVEGDKVLPQAMANTHPGFLITCQAEDCGSTRVYAKSDVGYSDVSGGWGGVYLICYDCEAEVSLFEMG